MSLPHFQTDPNIILPAAYLREYQVSISPLLVESWETDQYPINPKKRLKPHYIPLFRNKVIQPNMLLVMCIYLSCLSIYLSICLSIYLSVCLSIYLSFPAFTQALRLHISAMEGHRETMATTRPPSVVHQSREMGTCPPRGVQQKPEVFTMGNWWLNQQ